MLVKWKTSRYYPTNIARVECIRETDKCVWVPDYPWTVGGGSERRHLKDSDDYKYHETWEAAHAHLIERAEAELNAVRIRLAQAQSTHGNVKGMKPPTPQGDTKP